MTALVIDQADYFNFQVDDIDVRQAATRLVDAAMTDAAYRMRDEAVRLALARPAGLEPTAFCSGGRRSIR